jgi:hypothetical protein
MSDLNMPDRGEGVGGEDAALEDADEAAATEEPEGNPDAIGGPGRTVPPPD